MPNGVAESNKAQTENFLLPPHSISRSARKAQMGGCGGPTRLPSPGHFWGSLWWGGSRYVRPFVSEKLPCWPVACPAADLPCRALKQSMVPAQHSLARGIKATATIVILFIPFFTQLAKASRWLRGRGFCTPAQGLACHLPRAPTRCHPTIPARPCHPPGLRLDRLSRETTHSDMSS